MNVTCKFLSLLVALLLAERTQTASAKHFLKGRSGGGDINSILSTLIDNAQPLREELPHFMRQLEDNDDGQSSSSSSSSSSSANLLDFSSYSFRYATCQPVQRFSERSVKRGDYSSLVRDDLVIFRLCPQSRCSSSHDRGCSNGYGEYVASMYEYLSTMIQYKTTREQNFCEYCSTCANQRRRKLAYYADETQEEEEEAATDDNGSTSSSSIDCSSYSDKCNNYSSVCNSNESSADLSEYVACTEVSYNNKAFWISPYCDGGTILMGIFYDPYCSQFAGNSVKISEVTGKTFSKSLFSQYYSSDCISCASDSSGPYGTASSIMCNQLYSDSAKCNANMASAVDTTSYDHDQSVCNFAESIHYAFDSAGRYSISKSETRHVTSVQIALLLSACVACAFLSIYSCYVHHEITNLLLKQLSVRGKLVPSSGRQRAGYYSKSSIETVTEDEDIRFA
mmetsp:Transcript_6247/g.9141  ORF Transcript_6247/g.9141 Transcript_6247/m.9141 type:complete len:452 (-) Transcript_6247:184-1539(-)